jgi:hypothetical protein
VKIPSDLAMWMGRGVRFHQAEPKAHSRWQPGPELKSVSWPLKRSYPRQQKVDRLGKKQAYIVGQTTYVVDKSEIIPLDGRYFHSRRDELSVGEPNVSACALAPACGRMM